MGSIGGLNQRLCLPLNGWRFAIQVGHTKCGLLGFEAGMVMPLLLDAAEVMTLLGLDIRAGVRELLELLRLGWPMVGAQLGQVSMGLMDLLLVGHASSLDQAAVAIGNNLMFPSMLLFTGMLLALPPTVAQLRGGGRGAEVGEVFRQSVWVAALAGVAIIVVLSNASYVYGLFGTEAAVAELAQSYLQAIRFGIPALMGYFACRYLFEGLARPRPAMVIVWSALLLKLPLNLVLIYGWFGFPAMGAVGCGWATAVVMWFQFLAMLSVVVLSQSRAFGLFERFSWPDARRIGSFMRLGVPMGLTTFFEVGLFSMLGLMVSRLGAESAAAHQIALQIAGVAFMIPLALGQAATVRVGFSIGAENLAQSRRAAWVAVAASATVGMTAGVTILTLRQPLASLFNPDTAVVQVAAGLLLFVAVFQVVDAIQGTLIGVLRGFKDARVPMFIALICYWVLTLPLSYALAEGYVGDYPGLPGYWLALTLGLALAAVVLISRLAWISGNDARIQRLSAEHAQH